MKILAIETSCDETSVSILECFGGLKKPEFNILSNIVLSQIDIHKEFGGVVPNLAKREHQKNLVPILTQALRESGMLKIYKSEILNTKQISNSKLPVQSWSALGGKITNKFKKLQKILEREPELLDQLTDFLNKYEIPKIDLIAVTNGPGLEPALWVGVNFARALSQAWQIPLFGVNHLEGHIFSVLLKQNRKNFQFPALALIVSGGHTEIVLTKELLDYKIIGETLDDAAGEAFDKAARILGLGYPGGPAISREAEKNNLTTSACPAVAKRSGDVVRLPRPMINTKDFNFSFSGLKTAVLYLVQDLKKNGKWVGDLIPQIAYEFQEAVLDVLILKSLKATEKYNIKSFILCGGVSANKELRYRLSDRLCKKYRENFNFLMPELEFSGDNAAMIASAAYPNYLRLKAKGKSLKISPIIKANGNLNF